MNRWLRLGSCCALGIALGTTLVRQAGGTVPPSLGLLLQQSTMVVVATVVEVGPPAAERRTVVLRPHRFLRGELIPLPERLAFRSRSGVPDAVDVEALRASGSEQVFFLRHLPDALDDVRSFHLELADEVFGIAAATPALVRQLEEIGAAVERAQEGSAPAR